MKKNYAICVSAIVIICLFNCLAQAQSCTSAFAGGNLNWSALPWSCSGGGTAPTTNGSTYPENLTVGTVGNGDVLNMDITLILNGNLTINSSGSNPTVSIPAGVTVIINGNLSDDDNNVVFNVNGTLIVTGTLKAKNGTSFSGSGSISGGSLDLGNGPSCSGSCPGLSFGTCSAGGTFCTTTVSSSNLYTWNGSSSANWQTASNWTPTRTTPASTDALIFNASGSNKNITSIPTQTIGKMLVTGSATYSFVPTGGQTVTLSSTSGNAFQIDNGSTLILGAASNPLNITVPAGGSASIGGTLNLVNGNFGAGGATLALHTNATPLTRTAGQVSLDGTSVLRFGGPALTTGATIVLPNAIFVSAPTISSLIVNRTNGATLGDQPITLNTGTTLILGNLNTNAAGRIRFSSSATNPTESTASKIIGYAEMNSRIVGVGALNFLGFNMAAGINNVGNMSLTRRTGSSGINSFNANQSIASTWDIIAGAEPVAGRNVSFIWQSDFDNVTTSSNRFQSYSFNSGPGWTALGALQLLASAGPPRQTVAVSTTKLTDTFTVTDETQSLPVELISFEGKFTDDGVALSWTTASQENFDHFEIERSANGIDFNRIGFVTGDAFSVARIEYSYVDNEVKLGRYYYRLKNVDRDDTFDYSEIVLVSRSLPFMVKLYPNPVRTTQALTVEITTENEGAIELQLVDPIGKIIREWSSITLDNISTENLSPGLYLLRALNGTSVITNKLVVIN